MKIKKKYLSILLIIFLIVVVLIVSGIKIFTTKDFGTQTSTSSFTQKQTVVKNSLDINTFFNYHNPITVSAEGNSPNEYTIVATGDVIPARSVNSKLTALNNFYYPFEKTAELFCTNLIFDGSFL